MKRIDSSKTNDVEVAVNWLTIFFMVLVSCYASAGSFEDCFKKCLHKRAYHDIAGVDYIYMINAKKDLSLFRRQKKAFAKYNIVPYRFNAVDPDSLTYKAISNIGVKAFNTKYEWEALCIKKYKKGWLMAPKIMRDANATYFGLNMNMDKIARNLDFLSVIYDAYKSKKNCVWIMEDDVDIVVDPNILTGYLIALRTNDSKWDVLYTDAADQVSYASNEDVFIDCARPDVDLNALEYYRPKPDEPRTMDSDVSKASFRVYSYSFLLSRDGMKKILSYYHKHRFFIPFSLEMQLIPNMHVYSLREPIVTSARTATD